MDIGVEISLYPLREEFIPVIQDFIDRLNAGSSMSPGSIRVITNSMSTQVFGAYDAVFALLQREMRTSFEQVDKAIFVMKFLGSLTPAGG